MNALPLSGMNILVTRASHQARRLLEEIEKAGGNPVVCPAIEIEDAGGEALESIIRRLSEFDFAIFVSPNAVEKALKRIGAPPARLKFAVVGKSSLDALKSFGIENALLPEKSYDSEGLLELPEFKDVKGKRIAIFRGVGGREFLGKTLSDRGALVEYGECYNRVKPQGEFPKVALHALTAMSGETLKNLCEMGDIGKLRKTPIFVPHPRIAELAKNMGFEEIVVTGAGEEGLLRGLINWSELRKTAHG